MLHTDTQSCLRSRVGNETRTKKTGGNLVRLNTKIVAVLILIPFTTTSTFAATRLGGLLATKKDLQKPLVALKNAHFANQTVESEGGQTLTYARGLMDGEIHGDRIRTAGNFVAGLAFGTLLGLIGTGIGYFATSPATMNSETAAAMDGKGADYQLGFRMGWDKKTKSKKRGKVLGGGLIGSVVMGVIYLVSQN